MDLAASVQRREGAREGAGHATDLGREVERTCPIVQVVEGDAAGERLVEHAPTLLVGADEQLRDERDVAELGERVEAADEALPAGLVGQQLGVEDAGAGELSGDAVEHGPGRPEDLHADARSLLADELETAKDRRACVTLHAASGSQGTRG